MNKFAKVYFLVPVADINSNAILVGCAHCLKNVETGVTRLEVVNCFKVEGNAVFEYKETTGLPSESSWVEDRKVIEFFCKTNFDTAISLEVYPASKDWMLYKAQETFEVCITGFILGYFQYASQIAKDQMEKEI